MNAQAHQDPLQKMLVWSAAAHILLVASIALGASMMPQAPSLSPSSVAFIPLTQSAGASVATDSADAQPGIEPHQLPDLDIAPPGATPPVLPVTQVPTEGEATKGAKTGVARPGPPLFDRPFEYEYYAQHMLSRIQQHWQKTAVHGTAAVIIQFTILKDGAVRDAKVEQSSGVSLLDRAALRAVVLTDPMPPLPSSYPRDRVGVHIRFTYTDNH